MTKKKIAQAPKSTKRPARNREEQPETPTSRALMEALAEHSELLREALHRADRPTAGLDTGPLPEGLVERAAERAGVGAVEIKTQAKAELTGRIGEHLVRACDQLSEELAGYADAGGDSSMVFDALLSIWRARWELGLFPSRVSYAAKKNEPQQAVQAAGGAS